MNMDYYLSLRERIKDHCRQKQWYGPDTPLPGEGDEYYEDGAFHLHVPLHDPHGGFAFPPATEEQLSRTEEVMGFSHPPLLRALYLQVANGGFGPGTGIIGAFGGYCTDLRYDPRYIHVIKEGLLKEYGEAFCMESYKHLFNPVPFDLEQHEKMYGDPSLIILSERAWPPFFLQLCTWWYEEAFYLHVPTGHIYLGSAGGGKTVKGEDGFTALYRNADSLEEWLECWLEGGTEALYERSAASGPSVYYEEAGDVHFFPDM